MADGAAHRGHAACTHQHCADDVVAGVFDAGKPLPAKAFGQQRIGERTGDHAERAGDTEGNKERFVAPQHQQLQRVRIGRDKRQRFCGTAIGTEEHHLQRICIFAKADVGGDIPARDDRETIAEAAEPCVEAGAKFAAHEHEHQHGTRNETGENDLCDFLAHIQ